MNYHSYLLPRRIPGCIFIPPGGNSQDIMANFLKLKDKKEGKPEQDN